MDSFYDHEDEARITAGGEVDVRGLPYEPEAGKVHYDFRVNPSLIPEVLEDFLPFGHQRGVRKFYRLLRHLNGPCSVFETTDCALRGPHPSHDKKKASGAPLMVWGRLMVIYRDHWDNLDEGVMQTLNTAFHQEFARVRPGWTMGEIGTVFYWAWFSSISPEPSEFNTGNEFVLRFWAWGHDETECFDNFGTLMQGAGVALCRVQERYKRWLSLGRPSPKA